MNTAEVNTVKPQAMIHAIRPPSQSKCEPWRAEISDSPIKSAFAESIDIHPGLDSSIVSPNEIPSLLDKLSYSSRRRKTVAYINVPYCETRCLYCLFYIKPYRNKDESKAYADTLIKELQLWADRPLQKNEPVHAVYFGGGTPTALEANDIERVLKAVNAYLPLANDCEITYEGRISGFDESKMDAAVEGGANRFSLGVQSFNAKIRRAVGRRSSQEELIKGLQRLLSYDSAAVVVDLIYGFPFQTIETWLEDLRIVSQIGLDGVDCYQLRVFEKSPLHKYIANGKLPAGPDHEMRGRMFEQAVTFMRNIGWSRLSISHWASNTRERNFYNYYAKARTDCLAFGPGAGGVIDGYSFMQHRSPETWAQTVEKGQKPIAMLMNPSEYWDVARAVSEQMELNYFNPKALREEFSARHLPDFDPICRNWSEAGLFSRLGDRFELTVPGQFWQGRMTQHLLNFIKSQIL